MSSGTASKRWPLYVLAGTLSFVLLGAAGFAFSHQATLVSMVFGERSVHNALLPLQNAATESLPLSAEVLLQQAEIERMQGRPDIAVSLYEEALEKGGDLTAIRRLFDAHLLIGDTKKAESVLGLLSFRGAPEHSLEALRGLLLLRQGRITEARDIFSKEPDRSEHRFGLLLVSLIEGNHGEAKEHISLLMQSPDPFLAHAARSVQGAYDEFALFEDGRTDHLLTLLARSLGQIGEWPAAATILESVTANDPDYRDAQILLGYSRFMMGMQDAALEPLKRAYDMDPEKAETQYFLGLVYVNKGKNEEATMYLSHALQNGFIPKRSVREKLTDLAIERGAYEEAIGQLHAIVDEGEGDASSYRLLIQLLIDHRNDIEQARSLALAARELLGDTSADVLDLMGWTALLIGSMDEAATFLTTAVQQDPMLGAAWLHKGMLHEALGERDEALSAYRTAYESSIGRDQDTAQDAAERHNTLLVQSDGGAVSP